ncbi:Arsenate reductase thioredoxin-coupled, LMWP family [hydrothermal vent metagenome]|uniref:Arsenate reductase thioredoxin-coupled, LMWP family n=1 Tax=hydrothermal vent metagenome TaxID=652676 RepID=A0A3B1BZL4_9ZZZZ
MRAPEKKLKILFLCTGNSCRSQMAEGWARRLGNDFVEPYSAGIEKHGLNPNAVEVMSEAGVDISGHHSKTLDELVDVEFDYVVTVCGHANEKCPLFPAPTRKEHWPLADPAKAEGSKEEIMDTFRATRSEIRRRVADLLERLCDEKNL